VDGFRVFRRSIICLCLVLILSLLAAVAAAAPRLTGLEGTTEARDDARSQALRSWLKQVVAKPEIPGASLLVAQRGQVVFREGYGLADEKAGRPFTAETPVLTASVCKPLSATVVMSEVERGRIGLDDPAVKYLPAFGQLKLEGSDQPAPSPTLRQLLSHTSGLFGLKGASKTGMRAVRDFSLSLEESVTIIAGEKLVARPGERFNYGGANYQAAALIVQRVSGRSFDRVMAERMTGPLGLKGTYFRPAPGQETSLTALPYTYNKDKGLIPIAAYLPDPKRKLILASGGLYSSLNDLAVFLQTHLNGGSYGEVKVIGPEAAAEMRRRQTGAAEAPYGLGWFVDRSGGDGRTEAVSHPGLFGSLIWLDLKRELVGVFLTSSLWPGREALNREVKEKVAALFPAD